MRTKKRRPAGSKRYLWIFLMGMLLFAENGVAQRSRFLNDEYSRWYVEVSGGVPFLVGNLTSFAADKTYIGMSYGLRGGFQVNRSLGLAVSVGQGQNKMGARGYAADYMLGEDGNTYYLPPAIQTYPYKDIYSDVRFTMGGLHAEVNVINLLGGSVAGSGFSVLVIPGLYVQQFSATVKKKADDQRVIPSRSAMSFGLGGEVALRLRTGPWIDLQLRSGAVWMTDNDFIGFSTPIRAQYNYMWTTSLGVILKIPQRGRRDNLMYLPKEGDCVWHF